MSLALMDSYNPTVQALQRENKKLRAENASLKAELAEAKKERDALKTVPMKYRRMQFNAELQEEVRRLEQQLAAIKEEGL